jgi:prepilin-type N-terminal cleavage/methylation domain-containing protein
MMTKLTANCGFTLIEVLISLILITAITVPLIVHFYSNSMASRAEHEIVALSLAQQEQISLCFDGSSFVPLKKRTVHNTVYSITSNRNGEELVRYTVTISVGTLTIGTFEFMCNQGNF